MLRHISLALALLAAGSVEARWHSPRIVSPRVPDGYSARTFRDFHRFRGLSGDALAWALFEHLTDPRTGLYPMGAGAWEGAPDRLYEHGLVRDPVKMLNIYSLGYCDVLGPVMAGLWEEMGLGPARTVNLPGLHHVAAEVFYDGGWHYLDLDLRAVFRRPDGSLASLEEARRDASLWGPRGPRFFPMDDAGRMRESYRSSPVEYRHGVHQAGHTMDLVLRAGETFTRWWRPQGGRWLHHPSHLEGGIRRILESDPPGPKSKHPSFTRHTHGNGRLVYRPDLTERSADFEDGYFEAEGVRPGREGLTLAAPGKGFAVFEVRSPYVIVPLVGKIDSAEDDRDASVVEVDGEGVRASISLDGKGWEALGEARGRTVWDLTARASGRYGYLLRFDLEGKPEESALRTLSITTWVQVHPASLPGLGKGENRLELSAGDHHGLSTRAWAVEPDAGRPESLLPHLLERPKDYDPARRTARIRGECIAVLEAPPGTSIAWFSAGGSFATHQGEASSRTAHRMEWAAEAPQGFRELWRASLPAGNAHWHHNAAAEARLERPARKVFVRYTGDPALNEVRLRAHCLEERAFPRAPLVVRHRWSEGGRPRSFETTLDGPGEYLVRCEEEPEDESVEIAVPRTVRVSTVDALQRAVREARPGDAILIAEGRYRLPRLLDVRADGVTLRGETGRREAVVLDGEGRLGELLAITGASGVTIADLTVENVRWNGIKLNSDHGVHRATIRNCVIRNVWQRGIKSPRIPPERREDLSPRDCVVERCLFENERPKRLEDDPQDTYGGDYVGGMDIMSAHGWTIRDNVFRGIRGANGNGRGAIFLWQETRDCRVEGNVIVDCDTGIALGNSYKPEEVEVHCRNVLVRANQVTRAPQGGIVADFTRDCRIVGNVIHDPGSRLKRLIRLVHANDGLLVEGNTLSGPPLRNESPSPVTIRDNRTGDFTAELRDPAKGDLRKNHGRKN